MPLITNIAIMTITAYCHCKTCCGKPNQPAANGKQPIVNMTVAGPRKFPFNSNVTIEGLTNKFILTDRLAKQYDNRIDIFMSNHNSAKKWGNQQRKVTIICQHQ